jgi:hypothetical protein
MSASVNYDHVEKITSSNSKINRKPMIPPSTKSKDLKKGKKVFHV